MDDAVCLDTSVLIGFLKAREPSASAVSLAIENRTCWVTSVTVYELLFGVARSQMRIGEEELLSVLSVAPFDDAAARGAAKLHDYLIHQNADIGVKDVLIAAICLERRLPLLTLNERHIARVPDLQVISPESLVQSLAHPPE